MAGRKSAKSGNPEAVPASDENTAAVTEQPETPAEDADAEQEASQDAAPEEKDFKNFKITCRNNVSGMIGGVMFQDGVGYTRDGYSASWFANKDGYSVDPGE